MTRIFTENTEFIADLSVISSFIGLLFSFLSLLVSVFLIIEARKLSKSFIGKVRYSESISKLNEIWDKVDNDLKDFENNKDQIFIELKKARGIVINFSSKLTGNTEKRECRSFLCLFERKKFMFLITNKASFSKDECKNIQIELSGLISVLSEHDKDFKLRN